MDLKAELAAVERLARTADGDLDLAAHQWEDVVPVPRTAQAEQQPPAAQEPALGLRPPKSSAEAGAVQSGRLAAPAGAVCGGVVQHSRPAAPGGAEAGSAQHSRHAAPAAAGVLPVTAFRSREQPGGAVASGPPGAHGGGAIQVLQQRAEVERLPPRFVSWTGDWICVCGGTHALKEACRGACGHKVPCRCAEERGHAFAARERGGMLLQGAHGEAQEV